MRPDWLQLRACVRGWSHVTPVLSGLAHLTTSEKTCSSAVCSWTTFSNDALQTGAAKWVP